MSSWVGPGEGSDSTDPGQSLAGSPGDVHTTAGEVAIIVSTILVFVIAIVAAFYCKQLVVRRKAYLKYAAEEQDDERGARYWREQGGQAPGIALELGDRGKDEHAQMPAVPVVRENAATSGARLNLGDKPALWKFVNWKDPKHVRAEKPLPPLVDSPEHKHESASATPSRGSISPVHVPEETV